MMIQRPLAARISTIVPTQGASLSPAQLAAFGREIERSLAFRQSWQRQIHRSRTLGQLDIIRMIVDAWEAGDFDEAYWRVFLATHFGRPSARHGDPAQVESAGRLLCGFGTTPVWTWRHTSIELSSFAAWLQAHRADLALLRFGNHRKFESKQPAHLYEVIASFVEWVGQSGGSLSLAFSSDAVNEAEQRFDSLYYSLKRVRRFGRTARFDFLCLLSDLGLLSARPGSCYLAGATGPLIGARKLWGARPVPELERLAAQLAKELAVHMDVIEDALCNWQKRYSVTRPRAACGIPPIAPSPCGVPPGTPGTC